MIRLIFFFLSLVMAQISFASSYSKNLDQKNVREQFFIIKNAASNCIRKLESPKNDLIVHEQIFAPLGKISKFQYLFDSQDTLSEEQIGLLKNYIDVHTQCRFYYFQIPLKEIVDAYVYFYEEIDKVYEGLLSKDLTIGVANQKRLQLNESLQNQFNSIFNSLPK